MIDNFSILLSHGLIAIAFYLLMNRNDLDVEEPPAPDTDVGGFAKQPMASMKQQRTSKQQASQKNATKMHENKNA